jgi:rhodanese-related sulfurtransferase
MRDGEQLLVLDVREPDEYRQGHVAGSTLIPLNQLSLRIDELPRERPIVAICRSGNRSGVAAGLLMRAGFQDVANVTGGIIRWQQQGLPVERGK